MKTILFPLLVAFVLIGSGAPICFAQSQAMIAHGYVQDSLSGERLIGVTVEATNNGSTITTTTNSYGYFTLSLKDTSTVRLSFSYIGYETKNMAIDTSFQKGVIIKLKSVITAESEVVVVARSKENRIATGNIGELKFSSSLMKKMPKFLGDNDPLKAMQTLPGISQGMEGTSALIVRGGSPDQNLFLLDGTPIYNPAHLGGIFSPFNGDAIKDVTLYKGNFPARFGERLSSVIDLSTKDGNMKKWAGEGSIGMLAAKLLLEGPIQKDKSSFMISARRTYWDALAGATNVWNTKNQENKDQKNNLYFYDINAKLNYILSPKDRLYVSFFNSNDHYGFKTTTKNKNSTSQSESSTLMGWQNMAGSLRWNHLYSPKLFSNTMVYATNYKIKTAFNNKETGGSNVQEEASYNSEVRDLGLKSDFEYKASNTHAFRFGFQGSYKHFRPGSTSRKTLTDGSRAYSNTTSNAEQQSPELALYAEDNIVFSEKLNTNIGLRASTFKTTNKWYKSIEPRISANYLPSRKLRISASYSQMRQYIHLLANNSISLPTDIWVPPTDNIKPIFSQQVSLGISTPLANKALDLSIELYYKKYDGLVEYKDGESYLSSSVKNWENIVEVGKGNAYGIELFVQKNWSRSTGWMGYTYSRSERTFPTINAGKTFAYKYDRPHVFNIVYMYKLSQRWRFSANWIFQSGAPYTLETSSFKTIDNSSPYDNNSSFIRAPAKYISGRNEFRLLPYHRLDVGFTWSKKKKRYEKYWDFSLYNAYNKKNPSVYYFEKSDKTQQPVLKGTGLFPIIPSISYGFKF